MLTFRHVDTCTLPFLLDHCSREGEALLAAPVDGSTTWADLHVGLKWEWLVNGPGEGAWADVPDEAFDEVADRFFGDIVDINALVAPDAGSSDIFDETVMAWFCVTLA